MSAAASRDPFRVGIIGTGVGIRTHATGFSRLPGVALAGIVGTTPDRAQAALDSAGLPGELAVTFDELLARAPDLICVTTPPDEREKYLAALASVDTALLVEKPVASSAATADMLYRSFVHPARLVFVNVQLRGLDAFRSLRDTIASGVLGNVYYVALRERSPAFRRERIKSWEAGRQTGGGQQLAVGTHLLDLGVYICGGSYTDVDEHRAYGATSTPRGAWASSARSADLADEAFHGVVTVGGCWLDIFTTAIGHGPRGVEIDIEGTEGVARFRYRDGHGTLDTWGNSGTQRLRVVAGGALGPDEAGPALTPSLFRLAFPGYASAIVRGSAGRRRRRGRLVCRRRAGTVSASRGSRSAASLAGPSFPDSASAVDR